MVRRFGVLGSAGALLATAFVAVVTVGMSAAHADSFEDWATVSAGGDHTCGVRSNGKLYCWGQDANGQAGDGGDLGDPDITTPRRVGAFEDWATVAAGGAHTCGVRRNGKLYCWGTEANGQIGDGGTTDYAIATPRRIGTGEDWATVTAGLAHTCGIRTSGKLYCWGNDGNGEVGNGDGTYYAIPTPKRVGTGEDWASVTAGHPHTCGVRTSGKLYCWGNDSLGEVGDGGSSDASITTPRRIGTFEDWANVAAGGYHTCGVRKNGKLYCWGGNDGKGGLITTPQRVGAFEDWATVAEGNEHTCGVRKNGKLYCWGSDSDGQVGDGGSNDPAITEPRRIGTFEDWALASAGRNHSCGVRKNAKLYCWGSDSHGQVGDGENPDPAIAPRRI
jgi:alpha-tubulin suppressor-like RCC1 family protein